MTEPRLADAWHLSRAWSGIAALRHDIEDDVVPPSRVSGYAGRHVVKLEQIPGAIRNVVIGA